MSGTHRIAMPTSAGGDYVGTTKSPLHRERLVRFWIAAALIVVGSVTYFALIGWL